MMSTWQLAFGREKKKKVYGLKMVVVRVKLVGIAQLDPRAEGAVQGESDTEKCFVGFAQPSQGQHAKSKSANLLADCEETLSVMLLLPLNLVV